MAVERYVALRRKALKRRMEQLREDAGLTRGEVAKLLGCSQTRIADIENGESSSEYSIGEVELLSALLGVHPPDVVRMTEQNASDLEQLVTTLRTGSALLEVIDCQLPSHIEQLYSSTESFPADLVFSPDGEVLASIVDACVAEDWQEEEPCQLTVMCWHTRSGSMIGQIRLPSVGNIAPLDAERVAIRLYSASGMGSQGASLRRKLWKAQPISTTISRIPETKRRQTSGAGYDIV